MKRVFYVLAGVGFGIIFILSFIIPINPFEIWKGAYMDYPLFVVYGVGGGALYLLVLYGIYNLIEKAKDELFYITHKEQTLDYVLKKMIADKTDFETNKIKLLVAKKLDIEKYNEFDYFEFIYKKEKYILKKNKLEKVV